MGDGQLRGYSTVGEGLGRREEVYVLACTYVGIGMYVCVVCYRKCDTYVQDEGYGMIGLLFVVVAPDKAASLGRTCLVVTLLNPGVPGRGALECIVSTYGNVWEVSWYVSLCTRTNRFICPFLSTYLICA